MKKRSPWLALALAAFAAPALAQTSVPTRAEEARAARENKPVTTAPWKPGKVERLLTWVETSSLTSLNSRRDGFGVRVGGIENGAGLALGPSWRASNMFDGAAHVSGSAAASISGDREVSAGIAMPIGNDRFTLGVDVDATRLAQERFFGTGMASAKEHVTAFLLDRRRAAAHATLTVAPWLRISGSAATMTARAAGTEARLVPSIETRFSLTDAPGLGAPARFNVFSLDASSDSRDVPLNPRRGGRYHLAVARHADVSESRHSFTRLDAGVEQHLSAWRRQRVLTLRALASTAIADRGHQVPFYLQRTLGGSRFLRGFVTDRFRDRSLLVVQAEYGWDLSPFLNAVMFYEAGAAAPRLRDISAGSLRRDYGIGLRFGSARTAAFRTDVALGSGEGVRLTMRFNHAF